VGLGSASFTRFLHRYRPDARVTVVEIDPAVVAAARQFFKLPDESPRLRIEIADAHDYLAGTSARFDLLLVDGCDPQGYAGMLETLPFFLNCRNRLKTGGMMAVNLLTWRGNVAAVAKRIRTAFDDRVLMLPPCGAGNTIAIAANGREIPRAPDDLRSGVTRLKAETGLDLGPTLKRLG
jgi:spermidine synthase